jgi:hypothetical protein
MRVRLGDRFFATLGKYRCSEGVAALHCARGISSTSFLPEACFSPDPLVPPVKRLEPLSERFERSETIERLERFEQ